MSLGQKLVVRVDARWLELRSAELLHGSQSVVVEVATRDAEADEGVLESVALVLASVAQREARLLAAQGRYREAGDLVLAAARRLAAMPGPRAQTLADALSRLSRDYANHFEFSRNRSKLRAAERAMSKQRSSGSVMDEVFAAQSVRQLVQSFKRKDAERDRRDGRKR